eukprot:CAMPEP_0170739032 /NCGR_PEP_ID=MMETSP0437-20130122/4952_1 /TAXON_ID=0 /ORGANISM="Sexangularia sp." /LENGTH=228 /DNA_ID=CAMNT_0011077475 /DNA_START=154 /DNA_END=840 /DNA_ORIENTATION=-
MGKKGRKSSKTSADSGAAPQAGAASPAPAANMPTVEWAQRTGEVLLTLPYQDMTDTSFSIDEEGKFTFSGSTEGGSKRWVLDVELFAPVVEEGSKVAVKPRNVSIVLQKKEAEWWDRLTKQSGKKPWLKTDWNLWRDEDEDDEGTFGLDDPDYSAMGGMGGMGGGGMPGGLDMASLMAQMQGAGAGGDMPDLGDMDLGGAGGDVPPPVSTADGGDDDEDLPPLEDVDE